MCVLPARLSSVRHLQHHLKQATACLYRCLHLYPPLTLEQFRGLEEHGRKRLARVKKGDWRAYEGTKSLARAPQAFGPRMPTAAECQPDPITEDDPISTLRQRFVPSSAHIVWISDYIASRSREGPRATSHRFWGHKPTFHLSNFRHVILGRTTSCRNTWPVDRDPPEQNRTETPNPKP